MKVLLRTAKDIMCGGYEFEFVIFGLGFRIIINNPNSEGYKELERRIDEYKEDKEECIENE